MDGILIVNKPKGLTSQDVVRQVKEITGDKVGHAGTLDPEASGVLVCLVGQATKLSSKLVLDNKSYRAEMILGISTETDDLENIDLAKIKPQRMTIAKEKIENVLENFRGEIVQAVPIYSAVKLNGRELYKLARRGEKISQSSIPKRKVKIDKIELLSLKKTPQSFLEAVLEIDCSKGTYIRSLVRDIGENLGCGAVVSNLLRTKSGKFSLKEAVNFKSLSKLEIDKNIIMKNKLMYDSNKAHYIVVTGIIVKDGKYLITKRSSTEKAFPDQWTVPGGKLEMGDYNNRTKDTGSHWYNVLEDVLKREVAEEVNLKIKNIGYITSLVYIRSDDIPTLIISLYADYGSGNIKLCKNLTDYAWVSLAEAANYELIEGIYEELEMLDRILRGKKSSEWKRKNKNDAK
jgi:tRNA pseudouridine55 synthase